MEKAARMFDQQRKGISFDYCLWRVQEQSVMTCQMQTDAAARLTRDTQVHDHTGKNRETE